MNVRKIFFPVAAGLFLSPALWAADINTPSDSRTATNEYLSTADANEILEGGELSVILDAEYHTEDVIRLTFSSGALDPLSFPQSIVIPPGTLPGGNGTGLTLNRVTASADQIQYEVTQEENPPAPAVATTIGVEVTFVTGAAGATSEFNAQLVDAANGVTVTFEAFTTLLGEIVPLDTTGGDDRVVDYIQVVDQWAVDVDQLLDGIIDVNQEREAFENPENFGAPFNGGDSAIYEHIPTGAYFYQAAFDSFDVTINGDFSWIFDTDDATDDIQAAVNVLFDCNGGLVDVLTASAASYNCAFEGSHQFFIFPPNNVDPDGNLAILPAQTFTVTVDVNYVGAGGIDGTRNIVTGAGSGRWTLNGFQAELSYTPFGTGIGQVIYLANRGMQAGDITVDYVAQDGTSGTLGVIGTLQPTSTLSIGSLIRNRMPAALRSFGRVALVVTVNAPACDVQINAQYNASGNRAYTSARDNCDKDGGSF